MSIDTTLLFYLSIVLAWGSFFLKVQFGLQRTSKTWWLVWRQRAPWIAIGALIIAIFHGVNINWQGNEWSGLLFVITPVSFLLFARLFFLYGSSHGTYIQLNIFKDRLDTIALSDPEMAVITIPVKDTDEAINVIFPIAFIRAGDVIAQIPNTKQRFSVTHCVLCNTT